MSSEKLTFELLPDASTYEHVCCLNGPLVLENMFAFQEVLRSECITMFLHFTNVPYMDSVGLGILTSSYVSHQKQEGKLPILDVNERVQALFKITTLDRLFEVFSALRIARAQNNAA
jgi:anti-anti-sigma factor